MCAFRIICKPELSFMVSRASVLFLLHSNNTEAHNAINESSESKVLQIFRNVMLSSRSWSWRAILDYEMPNLFDTLQILLFGFALLDRSKAAKFLVLTLPDYTWSSKFLNMRKISWIIWFTVIWSTAPTNFN